MIHVSWVAFVLATLLISMRQADAWWARVLRVLLIASMVVLLGTHRMPWDMEWPSFQETLFLLLGTSTLYAAWSVVASNNPVRSALSLVLTFVSAAGLWFLLEAEFLAITLMVVYVGAVMVLFLFVVMMLDVPEETEHTTSWRASLGVLLIAALWVLLLNVLGPQHFGAAQFPPPEAQGADYNHAASVGLLLFTEHLVPFLLVGMLLLTAMISAIVLTHRGLRQRLHQTMHDQVSVKAHERLRLVDGMDRKGLAGDDA